MTEIKQKWIADTAKEIAKSVTEDRFHVQWLRDKYIAIIEKHCPEEFSEGLWAKMCLKQQAAEKLVEALIKVRVQLGYPLGTVPEPVPPYYPLAEAVRIIDSALTESEIQDRAAALRVKAEERNCGISQS